jgi:hypothetical protein
MKQYKHVLDFCFTVDTNIGYESIPREVLLKALTDRIKRIEESGEDTGIGLVDTEEIK